MQEFVLDLCVLQDPWIKSWRAMNYSLLLCVAVKQFFLGWKQSSFLSVTWCIWNVHIKLWQRIQVMTLISKPCISSSERKLEVTLTQKFPELNSNRSPHNHDRHRNSHTPHPYRNAHNQTHTETLTTKPIQKFPQPHLYTNFPHHIHKFPQPHSYRNSHNHTNTEILTIQPKSL